MEIHFGQLIFTVINLAILVGFIGGIVFLLIKFRQAHKAKISNYKSMEKKLDRVLEILEKEKIN